MPTHERMKKWTIITTPSSIFHSTFIFLTSIYLVCIGYCYKVSEERKLKKKKLNGNHYENGKINSHRLNDIIFHVKCSKFFNVWLKANDVAKFLFDFHESHRSLLIEMVHQWIFILVNWLNIKWKSMIQWIILCEKFWMVCVCVGVSRFVWSGMHRQCLQYACAENARTSETFAKYLQDYFEWLYVTWLNCENVNLGMHILFDSFFFSFFFSFLASVHLFAHFSNVCPESFSNNNEKTRKKINKQIIIWKSKFSFWIWTRLFCIKKGPFQ